MKALLGEAASRGAMLAVRSPVLGGRIVDEGVEISVGGDSPAVLRAATAINAAGLRACHVAAAIEGLPARYVPVPRYAQGADFTLRGKVPFSRLIYPVPGESGHLGVHLTLDLAGQARFGPSFRWVEDVDYAVDPADARGFVEAVRRYWPGLPEHALAPGYAGVRPRITGPGEPSADFRIDGPETHGVPGLVNLFGNRVAGSDRRARDRRARGQSGARLSDLRAGAHSR